MMKNMTYVIVTALYNQPKAFASGLGDQSRYLLNNMSKMLWGPFVIVSFLLRVALCETFREPAYP